MELLDFTTELYKKTFNGEMARAVMGGAVKGENLEDAERGNGPASATRGRAWFSGRNILQLAINYRWSDIVFDERYPEEEVERHPYGVEGVIEAVRAGDRAPDAPGLECLSSREGRKPVSRIFDIFNVMQHTALIFVDDPESAKPFIEALSLFPSGTLQIALIIRSPSSSSAPSMPGMEYVFIDSEEHARTGYGVGDKPMVVVVRPDSWIGLVATSAEGVRTYASRLFASCPDPPQRDALVVRAVKGLWGMLTGLF